MASMVDLILWVWLPEVTITNDASTIRWEATLTQVLVLEEWDQMFWGLHINVLVAGTRGCVQRPAPIQDISQGWITVFSDV